MIVYLGYWKMKQDVIHSDTPRGRESCVHLNGENMDIGDRCRLPIRGYVYDKIYVGLRALTLTPHTTSQRTSHMLASALSPPLLHSKWIQSLSHPATKVTAEIGFLLMSWPGPNNESDRRLEFSPTQQRKWQPKSASFYCLDQDQSGLFKVCAKTEFWLLDRCFTAHLVYGLAILQVWTKTMCFTAHLIGHFIKVWTKTIFFFDCSAAAQTMRPADWDHVSTTIRNSGPVGTKRLSSRQRRFLNWGDPCLLARSTCCILSSPFHGQLNSCSGCIGCSFSCCSFCHGPDIGNGGGIHTSSCMKEKAMLIKQSKAILKCIIL